MIYYAGNGKWLELFVAPLSFMAPSAVVAVACIDITVSHFLCRVYRKGHHGDMLDAECAVFLHLLISRWNKKWRCFEANSIKEGNWTEEIQDHFRTCAFLVLIAPA